MRKKNHNRTKAKATSLTALLASVLILSALAGVQFIEEVSAIEYTQYEGTLDGADFLLRIPDQWNGGLVVICRGTAGPTTIPSPSSIIGYGSYMLEQGFAVAASNYGSAGFCIQAGVNSTYELTMYIIDNYNVTGKVFLYGISMGGAVALLLGEKYPEVYSGVLDLFGIKDAKEAQTVAKRLANLTNEELTAELTALNITHIPPDWFSSLQAARDFFVNAANSTELALGGTPESNPQAYEDVSPTYHANIQIPVITVHGTDDSLVPYYQSIMYQDAVADAGRSSLHRLQTVPGGGHGWLFPTTEIPTRFDELVEWSNELTGARDWPMWGYDAQRSGYTTSSAPNTNQVLWTSTIGMAGTHPAVVDGKLYVGDWSGVFYCLDVRANGSQIWNSTAGAGIFSCPAVADGKVYVGSADNNTYCWDAMTGAKIWSYTTGGDVASSPVVANGKVYIGSNDGKLYCFRADHGQVVWKFTTGGAIQLSSPAVANGKVYIGSSDRKLYCVDAASGTLEWSYTTGDEVLSSPAVANGKVYVGSNDDKLYCLNAATGALIWSYTTGGDVGYSSPTIANGKVYVGSYDNSIYCLDATTGALIWSYTTGGEVWGSPTFADGKVYVGSFDRNFYCLDAATGALIWNYQTNGMVYSSPVVANGVAYAVSTDRRVYAFGAWEPIPESLTIGVMLLLSTIAVIVSARYFRKRQKWENW